MAHRILLVEDELSIRVGLEDRLRIVGYEVETEENGEVAVERASESDIDLIILDLILPGKDGLEICRELRQNGIMTPVLMLTARAGLDAKLRGFAEGADDYVTKPFDALELLARVRAVLNRSKPPGDAKAAQGHVIGGLSVDIRNGIVWREGQAVALSTMERALLPCTNSPLPVPGTDPTESGLSILGRDQCHGYQIANKSRGC